MSDSYLARYGPLAGPPPTGATYSATLASVICDRSGLKSAKPTRCVPVRNSAPDGARTGPVPRLPSSFWSGLPSAFGKSCARAGGGAFSSAEPESSPQPATRSPRATSAAIAILTWPEAREVK